MAELIDLGAERRRRSAPESISTIDDLRADLGELRELWEANGSEIVASASEEEIEAAHRILDEAEALGRESDRLLDEIERRLGI